MPHEGGTRRKRGTIMLTDRSKEPSYGHFDPVTSRLEEPPSSASRESSYFSTIRHRRSTMLLERNLSVF